MKTIKKKQFIILFLCLVIIIVLIYNRTSKKDKEVFLEIPLKTSKVEIADMLYKKGIIKNKYLFLLYVKIKNYDFSAGTYKLNTNMSYEDVCKKLQEGKIYKKSIKFTIPEGWTTVDIANRLDSMGIVSKDEFIKEVKSKSIDFKYKYEDNKKIIYPYEGFLFPDTYEVFEGTSAKQIIKMMLDRFLNVYSRLAKNKTQSLSIQQTVILASIVEKEAKVDSERNLIAGVFLNRFNRGIKLESCATVEYILPKHKEVLSYEDLQISSPYNTYKSKGFPPSAICNPGAKSLIAALNPEKTEYLYFASKGDGTHKFSKTYKEHLDFLKTIKR